MKEAGKSKKSTPKKKAKDPRNVSAEAATSSSRGPAKTKSKGKTAGKTPLKGDVPSILLEGDATPPPKSAGPGGRYVLGDGEELAGSPGGAEGLPEAYGTGRIRLVARDPHWLYANWDLTREQQRTYNGQSVDGHLVLRIFENERTGGRPAQEIHVHPESRNWFVHTGKGGGLYVAELGYYKGQDQWVEISISSKARTPQDKISEDTTFKVETLPMGLGFQKLLDVVKEQARTQIPLMEAIEQLRAEGHVDLPSQKSLAGGEWTDEQDQALAEVVSMDLIRRIWVGSLEVTELVRRHWHQEMSSLAVAAFSLPSSWSGGVSSFSRREKGARSFWFNVNAELVIYGATEPDARVTIGGRRIRLRDDGTFSFRFSLPDGEYELPAVAVAAAGDDTRSAELSFARATVYHGDVGHHPQSQDLKPPAAENL